MTRSSAPHSAIAAAAALVAASALSAGRASADALFCGGEGLPNCPQVTYVQPEYVLPQQPATVTLQGTDMDGITAVQIVPGNIPAPSHHVAPDAVSVDVPALPAGDYFFQLELARGPAPFVDGGGIIVDPSGGPSGPRAPRPVSDPTAAAAAAPVPTSGPTPAPSPPPSAAAQPVTPAAVTARLPIQDDPATTLLRILLGVAIACGLIEALNVLQRRRRSGGKGLGRAGAGAAVAVEAGLVAGGKANRFCASCGSGGAAVVRWRFENGGGMRVPLCRRCR